MNGFATIICFYFVKMYTIQKSTVSKKASILAGILYKLEEWYHRI